jgi:2-methylcitrate dehydratase PrpD
MTGSVLENALAHSRRAVTESDERTTATVRAMVIDTIGCLIGAAPSRMGRLLADQATAIPDGDLTVSGLGVRAAMPSVILAETTLVHVEEFDVFHGASAICPGGVTVVPALVVGSLLGRSGAELLTAVHLGAEAVLDVATAMGGAGLYAQRYWPSATFGAIGAAVTVGALLGLDDQATIAAMSISACQAGGLLSVADRFEAHYLLYGRAARTGTEAALLAGHGARGDRTVLDSVAEVAFGSRPQTKSWTPHLHGLTFKPYPVARPLHAAVEALQLLAIEHGLDATDIAGATLGLPSATHSIINTEQEPGSTDRAVCSAPFVLAAALAGVVGLASTFRDDALGELGTRFPVRIEDAPVHDLTYPQHWGATLTLELTDGRVLSQRVEDGLGGPTRPISEADLVRKFEQQSEPVLGTAATRHCLGPLLDMADLVDLRRLRALLAANAELRPQPHR